MLYGDAKEFLTQLTQAVQQGIRRSLLKETNPRAPLANPSVAVAQAEGEGDADELTGPPGNRRQG
jgi:hypothetical protein